MIKTGGNDMYSNDIFYNLMILTTYIFDLFIKIAFLDGIMGGSKRKLSFVPYILVLTAVEVIPYIIGMSIAQVYQNLSFPVTLVVCLISTLLVLLVTLLYDAAWSLRLFTAVFFFLFNFIDTLLFITLLQYANPATLTSSGNYLPGYIDFGSCCSHPLRL